MEYTYEIQSIGDSLVVKIFLPGQASPTISQPGYPNGEPWEDLDAASAWALAWIAEQNDPEAPEAPVGPGIEGRPKPAEEAEESEEPTE